MRDKVESVDSDEDIRLPALRETGALAEYTDNPGSELIGFLAFLRSELANATVILREETQEMLAGGDPFQRIHIINRLRLRRSRLENHLGKEVRQVMELSKSLLARSDKAVNEAVVRECKSLVEVVQADLRALLRDFEVD